MREIGVTLDDPAPRKNNLPSVFGPALQGIAPKLLNEMAPRQHPP